MKRLIFFFTLLLILPALCFRPYVFAQEDPAVTEDQVQTETQIQHGDMFVDENGDGYNDNAPDADGDGIPNGLDPDYTGSKVRAGNSGGCFVDVDGDGINDNIMRSHSLGSSRNAKSSFGPCNSAGNRGISPQDDGGFGLGAGTGNCAGTGPKGNANSGGRK